MYTDLTLAKKDDTFVCDECGKEKAPIAGEQPIAIGASNNGSSCAKLVCNACFDKICIDRLSR